MGYDRAACTGLAGSSPRSTYTIVYLGTSQTWGSGARLDEERLVRQIHRRLVQETGTTSLTSVNGSVSGSWSEKLLERSWIGIETRSDGSAHSLGSRAITACATRVRTTACARSTSPAPRSQARSNGLNEAGSITDNHACAVDPPTYAGTISMVIAEALARCRSTGEAADFLLAMHSDYWTTTATLQLFPRSRRIRVAFDSACRARFTELELRQVESVAATPRRPP